MIDDDITIMFILRALLSFETLGFWFSPGSVIWHWRVANQGSSVQNDNNAWVNELCYYYCKYQTIIQTEVMTPYVIERKWRHCNVFIPSSHCNVFTVISSCFWQCFWKCSSRRKWSSALQWEENIISALVATENDVLTRWIYN